MDLQLPLYFYHHEINATPDVIFEVINDDKEILNRVTKLSGFTYKNGGENHREEGTEGSLQYDNSAYKTKITHYSDERRLEFKTDLPSGVLTTVINIVPVEDRSELTISTKFNTESPVSFALYVLNIPRVKKEFNDAVKSLGTEAR